MGFSFQFIYKQNNIGTEFLLTLQNVTAQEKLCFHICALHLEIWHFNERPVFQKMCLEYFKFYFSNSSPHHARNITNLLTLKELCKKIVIYGMAGDDCHPKGNIH